MAFQPINFLGAQKQDQGLLQKAMGTELENAFNRVRNKHAEPGILADIAYKKASTKEKEALVPYYAGQAEQDIALKKAQAYEHQMKAQQAMLDLQFLQTILSGGMGGGSGAPGGQMPGQNMPQTSGSAMPQQNNFSPQQNSGVPQQNAGLPQQQGGIDFSNLSPAAKAYARHKLGAGQPTATSVGGGQLYVQDPLTGSQVIQAGRTPGQEKTETGLAEHGVEAVKDNYKTYSGAIAQKPNLQIAQKLLSNPKLKQAVGPFKSGVAKYLAPDEVKEIQSVFGTLGKNIITESARSFGARLTNQEMSWLQSILPTAEDTFPAIVGKVNTLEFLRSMTEKKAAMKDQLLRAQVDPIIADQMADSQLDYSGLTKMLKPTITFTNPNNPEEVYDIPKYDTAKIEIARKAKLQEID